MHFQAKIAVLKLKSEYFTILVHVLFFLSGTELATNRLATQISQGAMKNKIPNSRSINFVKAK